MSNIKFLHKQLYVSINELIDNYSDFLSDDKNYFSRDRKLPLKTLTESILFMGANTIKDELYDFFDFNNIPTTSAFVQQRQKIKADAFRFLFDTFNEKTYSSRKDSYKGYRLLAIDGSSIPISHDPCDKETYIKQIGKVGLSFKGHNAFNEMVSTYHGIKAIFIADRGFESINSFVYCMKANHKYLIRVKDIHSNGILSSLPKQTSEEFDIDYQFIATKKQTKEVLKHKEIYKFMSTSSKFDHFKDGELYYPVDMRIVRMKTIMKVLSLTLIEMNSPQIV